MNRRTVLTAGLASLAGLAAGELALAAGAEPTAQSGDLGAYGDFLKTNGLLAAPAPTIPPAPSPLVATEKNLLGPFFRDGAPTRYTITQPYEPGTMMVIRGRVWGLDTRKPIAGAVLHIWHADDHGRYDNSDDANPPADDVFVNRGMIFADRFGVYDYQTIHPGRYLNGRQYRPAHIHYLVMAPGYQPLVTQLYFDGDPYNAVDPFIHRSLIIKLAATQRHGKTIENGVFDIVLRPVK